MNCVVPSFGHPIINLSSSTADLEWIEIWENSSENGLYQCWMEIWIDGRLVSVSINVETGDLDTFDDRWACQSTVNSIVFKVWILEQLISKSSSRSDVWGSEKSGTHSEWNVPLFSDFLLTRKCEKRVLLGTDKSLQSDFFIEDWCFLHVFTLIYTLQIMHARAPSATLT